MNLNGHKPITIIGGGISGLSLLHFLKQRAPLHQSINLLEKKPYVGGNIQSIVDQGFLCEYGPNAFLNNKPTTLDFIDQLGIRDQLLTAKPSAQKRYVCINNALHALPMDPVGLCLFKPFTWQDKINVFTEIAKGRNPDNVNESIAQFVARRLGKAFVEVVIDPFVSGVYAGDVERLHMASCFPVMIEMENQYGSLIKAMIKRRKSPSRIMSFRGGMRTTIDALAKRYHQHIQCSQAVDLKSLKDHQIVFTFPAYITAGMIKDQDPLLAQALDQIPYAPIIVVGLAFDHIAIDQVVNGFGYLNPSSQRKQVLGVLFESSIFDFRAPHQGLMLRVMIGGRRHPEVLDLSENALVDMALAEINHVLGINQQPKKVFFQRWPQAIPQYEMDYPSNLAQINQLLKRHPQWYLSGNYLHGISFNDCIYNSQQLAQRILP